MSEFFKRAISALVFVVVVIFMVVYHCLTLGTFVFLVSSICFMEYLRMQDQKDLVSKAVVLICNTSLIASCLLPFILSINITLAVCFISIFIYIIYALYKYKLEALHKTQTIVFSIAYISIPFYCFLDYSLYNENTYNWQRPLLVLVLVWASDTFAYLSGRLLGKNLLFASISPKKTIEGLIGGSIFAGLTGVILAQYWDFIRPIDGLILGILVSLFGTVGDFFESAIKRKAEVKDSGNIMPGHGGMLDRFDAFLFASVVVYFYFQLGPTIY